MSKKHLSDLYRRGKNIEIPDDEGDTITIYIQKLNPVETKLAREKGNAARARVLLKKRDRDSDAWLNVYSEAIELEKDEQVNSIVFTEVIKRRAQIEEEQRHEDEWAKEDFLDGIQQSWQETFKEVWVKSQDEEEGLDPVEVGEAKKIWDELNRFNDQVNKIMESEEVALRKPYENMEEDELLDKTVEALFETVAFSEWSDAYWAARTFYSVKYENDHNKKYFKSIEQVMELEPEISLPLLEAYRNIELSNVEVKDSEQTPTS